MRLAVVGTCRRTLLVKKIARPLWLTKKPVGNVLLTPPSVRNEVTMLGPLAAARMRTSGVSGLSSGMAVASTSKPATRLTRYSNDPANDHEVVDSKLVADTLPPALAPRSSWADAALERRRSTKRVPATRGFIPPV